MITKERDALLQECGSVKKDISSLGFKLKDQEMNATLSGTNWEARLNNLQQ